MQKVPSFVLALLFAIPTALARGPVHLDYLHPTLNVLGLYDSSDATQHGQREVLAKRVRPALKAMGLKLVTHDVQEGLPATSEMDEYRAVVTAFGDVRMKNASRYLEWLAAQLAADKRVVILGNLGAYQDAEIAAADPDKGWVSWDRINHALKRLGIQYSGQWIDDPARLKVVRQDPTMFRGGKVPSVASVRHYYRFKPISAAVHPYLVLDRTDIPDGESAVVFGSEHGGLAMEGWYESQKGHAQVNTARFLERTLLSEPGPSNRVLFALDPRTSAGHAMERNLAWIVRYSRLQADFVRLRDLNSIRRFDLRGYGSLVFASYDNPAVLGDQVFSEIERWVREDGGGLVCLFPVRRPQWDRMLGIKWWKESTDKFDALKYGQGFFPGLDGLFVRGGEYEADVHPVGVTPEAEILAWASRGSDETFKGPAVLWRKRHGRGRVVFRNDGALTQKSWRGQTLQMVLQSMAVAAVPIIDALVYYIDDCPQPMWNVKRPPIDAEFGLSDTDFYGQVWWPDMLELAKEFGLKYTMMLIFSYDDETNTGFSADPFYAAAAKGVPTRIAHEAIANGHEVGLHGYNHQSLIRQKGYTSKGWTGRQAMVDAFRLARREWQRLFGPGAAPFTYVAPNNHIGRAGKEALSTVFPEVRVIAAQYLDEPDKEGQEWRIDPDVGGLLSMPRVSSEFYVGAGNNAAMLDSVMLNGSWMHFVHPDDVYDPERNGGFGWKRLKQEQRKMVQHMRLSFPWLRPMTARDAYYEVTRFLTSSFNYRVDGDRVVIDFAEAHTRPVPFMLRLDPSVKVKSVENGKIVHRYANMGYVVLQGTGPQTIVNLER